MFSLCPRGFLLCSVLVKSRLLEENPKPHQFTKPAQYIHICPYNSLYTFVLKPIDEYSLHPSSKKHPFTIDGNHYKKTTTNQNAELWSKFPVDASTEHSHTYGTRNIADVAEGLREPEVKL